MTGDRFSRTKNKSAVSQEARQAMDADAQQTNAAGGCAMNGGKGCHGCGLCNKETIDALKNLTNGGKIDAQLIQDSFTKIAGGDKIVSLLLSGDPRSREVASNLISYLEKTADIKQAGGSFNTPEAKALNIHDMLVKSGYKEAEVKALGIPEFYTEKNPPAYSPSEANNQSAQPKPQSAKEVQTEQTQVENKASEPGTETKGEDKQVSREQLFSERQEAIETVQDKRLPEAKTETKPIESQKLKDSDTVRETKTAEFNQNSPEPKRIEQKPQQRSEPEARISPELETTKEKRVVYKSPEPARFQSERAAENPYPKVVEVSRSDKQPDITVRKESAPFDNSRPEERRTTSQYTDKRAESRLTPRESEPARTLGNVEVLLQNRQTAEQARDNSIYILKLERQVENQIVNRQLDSIARNLDRGLTDQGSRQMTDLLNRLAKSDQQPLSADAADNLRKLALKIAQGVRENSFTGRADSGTAESLIRQINQILLQRTATSTQELAARLANQKIPQAITQKELIDNILKLKEALASNQKPEVLVRLKQQVSALENELKTQRRVEKVADKQPVDGRSQDKSVEIYRQTNTRLAFFGMQKNLSMLAEVVNKQPAVAVVFKQALQEKLNQLEKVLNLIASDRLKTDLTPEQLKKLVQALSADNFKNMNSDKSVQELVKKLSALQNVLESSTRKDRQTDLQTVRSRARDIQQNIREIRDLLTKQLNLALPIRQSLQEQLVRIQKISALLAEGKLKTSLSPEQLKKLSELLKADSLKNINSDAAAQQLLRNMLKLRTALEQSLTVRNAQNAADIAIKQNIKTLLTALRQPVKELIELRRVVRNIEALQAAQNNSRQLSAIRQDLMSRLNQALQKQLGVKQGGLSSEMADRLRVMLALLAEEREISVRMLKELRELIQEQLLSDKDYVKLRAELRKTKRKGPEVEQKQSRQQSQPKAESKKANSFHKEVKNAKTGNAIVTTQRGPSGTLDVVTAKEDDKPEEKNEEQFFQQYNFFVKC